MGGTFLILLYFTWRFLIPVKFLLESILTVDPVCSRNCACNNTVLQRPLAPCRSGFLYTSSIYVQLSSLISFLSLVCVCINYIFQSHCYCRGFFNFILCSYTCDRFLLFTWSNLLSSLCKAVIDVFVLLNFDSLCLMVGHLVCDHHYFLILRSKVSVNHHHHQHLREFCLLAHSSPKYEASLKMY
jgi:hypothetical protein